MPKAARAKPLPKTPDYAPARRLLAIKALLDSPEGASLYDIAERFDIDIRTAKRCLTAIEAEGAPLYADFINRRKVWRLMPSARVEAVPLSTSQMVSLFLSRRVFDFLAGTGFKEDLDEVFAKLEKTLRRRDYQSAKNLDRKFFDINEAPHVYEGRLEHVNEIVTALLREERLEVVYETDSKPFLLDPYTMFVYKKGLYLAGYSHKRKELRHFALDRFREVDWLKGQKFEYPEQYHPNALAEGAFGLIGGVARTRVRILFGKEVGRFVRRRKWHPTQQVRTVDGQTELTMEVSGMTEILSWVLGFGDKAEVLEPSELRDRIAAEHERAAALYRTSR